MDCTLWSSAWHTRYEAHSSHLASAKTCLLCPASICKRKGILLAQGLMWGLVFVLCAMQVDLPADAVPQSTEGSSGAAAGSSSAAPAPMDTTDTPAVATTQPAAAATPAAGAATGSGATGEAGQGKEDAAPPAVPYARKLLIKFLLRAINIQSFSQAHGNAARPQVCMTVCTLLCARECRNGQRLRSHPWQAYPCTPCTIAQGFLRCPLLVCDAPLRTL